MFWTGFGIGVIVGAVIVIMWALLSSASLSDNRAEEAEAKPSALDGQELD